MSSSFIGFFWATISALCLGAGTFLYKISSKSIGAVNTTFYYYLFSIVIAFGLWIATPNKETFEKSALIWPALMAVLLCASVLTFSTSVKSIDMTVASTIRGLSLIPSVVLAFYLYGEKLNFRTSLAIILVICSVILLGWDSLQKN